MAHYNIVLLTYLLTYLFVIGQLYGLLLLLSLYISLPGPQPQHPLWLLTAVDDQSDVLYAFVDIERAHQIIDVAHITRRYVAPGRHG